MPLAKPHHEVYVEYDQACIGCDYALRGLPITGVCPECGMPIARSFRGDRLAVADPDYVATLLRGATLLLAAVVVPLVVLIAAFAITVFTTRADDFHAHWKILLFIAASITAGLVVAAAFNLTARDPEDLGGPACHIGRMAARTGAIVATTGGLLTLLLALVGAGEGIAFGVTLAIGLLGLLATSFGVGLTLMHIVRRCGEQQLVTKVRTCLILFAFAAALAVSPWPQFGGLMMTVTVVYGLGVLEVVRAALKSDLAAAQLHRALLSAAPGGDPRAAIAPQALPPQPTTPQPTVAPSGTLP